MTGQEIINKLMEIGKTPADYDEHYGWSEPIEGIGEVKQVLQEGGEGQGDTYTYVIYFPEHDVYLRTDGSYQSDYGTDFDYADWYVVRPQEKVITVYE